jgi:8-oxo-dGTP pyrophosphatase MutT (NUDIX family)
MPPSSDPDGPVPVPASTVVLVRARAAGGIEILLVQRHAGMGFMGGMHVFPGGKVSADDASSRAIARVEGRPGPSESALWGPELDPAAVRARAVAGIRETFEEAGVLLGCDTGRHDLADLRSRLLAGEAFSDLLEARGLTLELRALQPLSRWITPETEGKRFDTSFYVARAPAGQTADHDRKESVASGWFTPGDALHASRSGQIRLAPPTALTLEGFLEARTVDDALALAASRPPPVILPILRVLGDERVILYPGDPEHPVATPAFAGPTRRVFRR